MTRLPRSPARVAFLTVVVVLVVGLVGALTFLSITGRLHDHPNQRGQALGRGLFPLSLIAGGIAYAIQRRRTR